MKWCAIPDWRRVLRRAWSVRLMLLAALLEGAATVLPLFTPMEAPVWWGGVVFVVVVAACAARFVKQPKMQHGNNE